MLQHLPKAFSGYTAAPVSGGRSGAQVYRLTADEKPTLFLKCSDGAHRSHLQGAAARLEWLSGKLPAPEVVAVGEDSEGAWLLMTEVPGLELSAFNEASPEGKRRLTAALANALRRFHETPAGGCPFDHSAARELGRLEREIAVREAVLGYALPEAREKLETLRHLEPEETLVLTHGDACLPNVMVVDCKLSGFIDLGDMGLADRCRDLERACWSLSYNYGGGYDEMFLEAYGATEADRAKLDFYRRLEWFSLEPAA